MSRLTRCAVTIGITAFLASGLAVAASAPAYADAAGPVNTAEVVRSLTDLAGPPTGACIGYGNDVPIVTVKDTNGNDWVIVAAPRPTSVNVC